MPNFLCLILERKSNVKVLLLCIEYLYYKYSVYIEINNLSNVVYLEKGFRYYVISI